MVKNIKLRWEDRDVQLQLSDDAAGICIVIYQLKEEIKKLREKLS